MDEPITLRPGEGEGVKADRPELSLLEVTFDPGSGVDPHLHKRHSDSFFVLEGEVEFHVGDEVVHGTPGTYVLAPPNVVHWFRNVSDEPVRMLNLHTPGGFAEYRRELRALRAQGVEPDTAWFVPAVKDERRVPVDAKLVVARTRDGGKSFSVLSKGLPQEAAYDLAYRHGLDVDASGNRVAFGSTTGNLWLSEDQGDSWRCLSTNLPPISCVKFG